MSSGEVFPRAGTDESGKGDYFGPLVVAAVAIDEPSAESLRQAGVRDSKRLSDRSARDLAGRIRSSCPSEVVAIGPVKYNELYERLGNLNRLLAWAHARAIENLLARTQCHLVVTDQFGDERYVRAALMARGRQVELRQFPGAEADLAVAAASVVARAGFLDRLERLAGRAGTVLPKGAGPAVEAAALLIARERGREGLGQVAKLHFRTTVRILRRAGMA